MIVQGPVAAGGVDVPHSTTAVLASVRRVLPAAEIILSTWPGQNLAGLAADVVVQPADPGPQLLDPTGTVARKFSNLNRQTISTLAGLRAARRPWAVKLRSDTFLRHAGFLDFAKSDLPRNPRWQIFQERIVVSDLGSHDPRFCPMLFHVSDLFHFGRREDLLQLWDNPPAPEPATSRYFADRLPPPIVVFPDSKFVRWTAEQYLWLTCLRRNGRPYELSHSTASSVRLAWASEQLFLNNFRPAATVDLGIVAPAHLEGIRVLGFHYTAASWAQYARACATPAGRLKHFAQFVPAVLKSRLRARWRTYADRHPDERVVKLMRRRAFEKIRQQRGERAP